MRPPHVVNGLRLGYVLEQIAHRLGRPVGELHRLRIADIGCGARPMGLTIPAQCSATVTCVPA